jgi:cytochrome c oxidase subunit 4
MSEISVKSEAKNPAFLYPFYTGIWLILLALTGMTLVSSLFDLGRLNIIVALAIATGKASLVTLFFMHLKEESPLFKAFFLISCTMLAIFIGLTFFDVAFR